MRGRNPAPVPPAVWLRALLPMMIAVAACGEVVPRTQVMVIVDAEPGVRSQTHDVEIVVRGGTGSSTQWQGRLDRTLTIDDQTTWPFSMALVPLKDDAARVYEVVATARAPNDDTVGRVRAISGYRKGATLELRLVFEDACRALVDSCSESQTCRDGACADANVAVTSLDPYKPSRVDGGAGTIGMSGSGGTAAIDSSVVDASTISADANLDANETVDASADAAPVDPCTEAGDGPPKACDDGNACTTMDQCVSGSCVGSPIVCDDDNECTDDSCDPSVGCVNSSRLDSSCNDDSIFTDGDACNASDICVGNLIQCRSCSASAPCPSGYECQSGRCLKRTSSLNPVCPPGSSVRQCSICAPGVGCASGYLCASGSCGCS